MVRTSKKKKDIFTCPHCNDKILNPAMVGFTIICPTCKKFVNNKYNGGGSYI